MRVLIVEDHPFNAFCLSRLLQSAFLKIDVQTVANSALALEALGSECKDVVIVDGDLGASDGILCNGPALADAIWQLYPEQPIIAWTDSESQKQAFAHTFSKHHRPFTSNHCWPKVVSARRIEQALADTVGVIAYPYSAPMYQAASK